MGLEQTFKVFVDAADKQEMLTAACQRLTFTQTTTNALSEAEIVFRIKGLYDGEYMADVIPKETVKSVPVKFQIFDLNDNAMTALHHHVCVDHRVDYNNRGEAYSLTFFTREQCKNDMRLVDKSVAHEFSSLHEMVNSLLENNGFSIKTIEKTPEIPEFGVLRQPYINDYEFLVQEINPRAQSENGSSGYRLFTSDGKEAVWSTIGYESEDVEVPDEMLIDIVPSRRAQWVAEKGSAVHSVIAFDMDNKSPLSSTKGPDVSPSYGEMALPDPYKSSASYTHFPMTTQQAADSFALRCQYLEAYTAFPFTATIRGSAGWDKVPYNLKVKIIHDQGGGELRGYATTIKHVYSVGEYKLLITCLRDKGGSL